MDKFDIVVIGGGPGGYVAAIRAAQLGKSVAIIEKRKVLGGTCGNVGCIPTKALLDSTEKFHLISHGVADHGINVEGKISVDLKKMMERKDRVVKELNDGLDFLMKKNKIRRLLGHGSLSAKDESGFRIEIKGDDAGTIEAAQVILATGSVPIEPSGMAADGESILTSDHALSLEKIPESLAILGGGVIGLEMGSIWARLGTKVTIIEMMPEILPTLDKPVRDLAKRSLVKQGLEIRTAHKVTAVKAGSDSVEISLENKKGESENLKVEKLLLAPGRRPYHEGLGLESVGIKVNDRGRIEVNPESLETNIAGIYAIGDVVEGAMLAHRAEEEGIKVAEILAGKHGHVNYAATPYVIYTWPEIAWVGESEEALKARGIEVKTGKFLYRANGRAKAMNESDGIVRIIADARTDTILGVAIFGACASELISEAVIAIEFGASSEDIARSFHAHPTLAETIREAALDLDGRAIHS